MLLLLTDYGLTDPYVGQLKHALLRVAPEQPIIDLLHEVPDFNAHAGAHLLAAFATASDPGDVFLAVVDPGVGGPRDAVVVRAEERWFVGPDNGLLSVLAARAETVECWRIYWHPNGLSDTFHGRDLFAPIAAQLAKGEFPADRLERIEGLQVQFDHAELPRIIYIDHYGNAWTGVRGGVVDQGEKLAVKGQPLVWKRTFSDAAKGEPFWHVNSSGLIELSCNRGDCAQLLDLKVGDKVEFETRLQRVAH